MNTDIKLQKVNSTFQKDFIHFYQNTADHSALLTKHKKKFQRARKKVRENRTERSIFTTLGARLAHH